MSEWYDQDTEIATLKRFINMKDAEIRELKIQLKSSDKEEQEYLMGEGDRKEKEM